MTQEQALRVVSLVTLAYPTNRLDEATLTHWVRRLQAFDHKPALAAVEALVDASERMPNLPQIVAACRAASHPDPARKPWVAPTPALPVPRNRLPSTPEQAFSLEGAWWALARQNPGLEIPESLRVAEADIPVREAEARDLWESGGSTFEERKAAVLKAMREALEPADA